MDARTRQGIKVLGLGLAGALLFTPGLFDPPDVASALVATSALALLTIPLTWWLVTGRVADPEEHGHRFAAAGRFYVWTFLLYWGASVALRRWPVASESIRSSLLGRAALLGACALAGYALGVHRAYRPALQRLRDAWVKDLTPEEHEELESLRQEERDERSR